MLEPLLNAAVEAQAINRVHRGGQTRPTTVHRLVVRGTIEEEIERQATLQVYIRHTPENATYVELCSRFVVVSFPSIKYLILPGMACIAGHYKLIKKESRDCPGVTDSAAILCKNSFYQ